MLLTHAGSRSIGQVMQRSWFRVTDTVPPDGDDSHAVRPVTWKN